MAVSEFMNAATRQLIQIRWTLHYITRSRHRLTPNLGPFLTATRRDRLKPAPASRTSKPARVDDNGFQLPTNPALRNTQEYEAAKGKRTPLLGQGGGAAPNKPL